MNKLVVVIAILAVAALVLSLSKGGFNFPDEASETSAPARP